MDKRALVQIREGVFETNSSSVHALAIHKEHQNSAPLEPDYEDECIHVYLQDFWCGPERYNDLYHKLSYLLTFIKMTEYEEAADEAEGVRTHPFTFRDAPAVQAILMNTDGFIALDREVYSYCGYHIVPEDPNNATLDHQSYNRSETLYDLMHNVFHCSLHDFLFDTAYELIIDHDDTYPSILSDEEIAELENKDDFRRPELPSGYVIDEARYRDAFGDSEEPPYE